MKKLSLISIAFITLLLSCKNNKSNEDNTIGSSDDNSETMHSEQAFPEYSIDDYSDFVALFPLVDQFPASDELMNKSFAPEKEEYYSKFSSFIQYQMFTDASEYTWTLQPILRYEYADSAYVMVAVEYKAEENTECYYLIRHALEWNEYSEEYEYKTRWEIEIAKTYGRDIIKEYTFLNSEFDSVKIIEQNKRTKVLKKFDNDFLDINKFYKLTQEEINNVPDNYDVEAWIPEVSFEKNSSEIIEELHNQNAQKFKEFSNYLHSKTSASQAYTGRDVNYVPYIFPIGKFDFNDSLSLYVLFSEPGSLNYSEKRLKLILCHNGLTNPIDRMELSYTKDIKASFVAEEEFLIELQYNDENTRIFLYIDEEGIKVDSRFLNKFFASIDAISTPMPMSESDAYDLDFIDIDDQIPFLEVVAGQYSSAESYRCFGKIETSSQNVLLVNSSQEVTSGEHFVVDTYYALSFNKSTGKLNNSLLLFSRFDGEQSYITENEIFKFQLNEDSYGINLNEDGSFADTPSDTVAICHYGFVKKSHLYTNSANVEANTDTFLDLFTELTNPNDITYKQLACSDNDAEKTFSHQLNSLLFKNQEKHFVKYIPMDLQEINDSIIVLSWKRLDPESFLYNYNDYPYIKESGIFNKNTNTLKPI